MEIYCKLMFLVIGIAWPLGLIAALRWALNPPQEKEDNNHKSNSQTDYVV